MLAALRSRLGIYGLASVITIVLIIVIVAGYRLYNMTLASTPEKAVAAYLDTLNKGDMAKLYEMTLNGSGQSQAEFAGQMAALAKDKRLSTDGAAVVSVGRQGNAYYFQVTAKLRTNDGSYRLLPLLLQAAQEGTAWRVALFTPPAALPPIPTVTPTPTPSG